MAGFDLPGDNAKRVFYIRKAAYETLSQWGVEIPKPVLEEKVHPLTGMFLRN